MKQISFLILAVALIFSACKKDSGTPDTPDPKEGLVKISEGYALGASAKVEVWSGAELSTGYQRLFIALYDSVSNNPINKADVKILPMMDMNMNGMMMSHSSPFENPTQTTSDNTLFPCAAVFTMPSSSTGVWKLNVTVTRDGQSTAKKAELQISVKQAPLERVRTLTASDGTVLVVSYVEPLQPKVGINDFEITIHRRASQMSFVPADNLSIVMVPEMPSMGHGSPNNINPVFAANGHYKGKVNFTMTGDWKVNLDINSDSKIASTYFDLLF